MTTSTDTPESRAMTSPEAPVKEPILMNWIIIFATVGALGFAAHILTGF